VGGVALVDDQHDSRVLKKLWEGRARGGGGFEVFLCGVCGLGGGGVGGFFLVVFVWGFCFFFVGEFFFWFFFFWGGFFFFFCCERGGGVSFWGVFFLI